MRGRMMVFGGYTGAGFTNDVWMLSLRGPNVWSVLPVSGDSPPAMDGHTAVYDPAGDRVILFGGNDGPTRYYDIWILSLSPLPQWTHVQALNQIGARFFHGAVWDAVRDRMVIGGGMVVSGAPYADMWSYSPSTNLWSTTVLGMPPRVLSSTALDVAANRLIVFGGWNGNFLNDCWSFSLAGLGWTQLEPQGTPPPPMDGHVVAFDEAARRLIVFGGNAGGEMRNDTWSLDLAGDPTWTTVATSTPPEARFMAAAAFDAGSRRMVVFAGAAGYEWLGDTWGLDVDTGAWEEIAAPIAWPRAMVFHTAIYDPVRDRMITFFDSSWNMWAYSLDGSSTWEVLPTVGHPTQKYMMSAIYDPVGDRIVIFAGFGDVGGDELRPINETWELPLTGVMEWRQLEPVGVPPNNRDNAMVAYDGQRHSMVVFGGDRDFTTNYNDLWVLDLNSPETWTELQPAGEIPIVRTGAIFVYDGANERYLLYGGRTGSNPLHDLWELTLEPSPTWRMISEGSWDDPDFGHECFTFEPEGNRIIAVGGGFWDAPHFGTRSLSMAPPEQWTDESVGSMPAFRAYAGWIKDSRRNRMLVWGGGDGARAFNELWELTWDFPTAVAMSLVSSEVEGGQVRLVWQLRGDAGDVSIQRRDANGGWVGKGVAHVDGLGRVTFTDGDVTAGRRYAYRVGVRDGSETSWSSETWVDVSERFEFALMGARPNPVVGDLVVRYSLPDRTPAELELFDVSGRRVKRVEWSEVVPGVRSVRVASEGELLAGVYVARLVQGGRSAKTRFAVVR